MSDDRKLLITVNINKKHKFQKVLKEKNMTMKKIINYWIDLYLADSIFSKEDILNYITLTFHNLINSRQVDEKVFEIFLKQFNDNLFMFKPENVKEAVEKIGKVSKSER